MSAFASQPLATIAHRKKMVTVKTLRAPLTRLRENRDELVNHMDRHNTLMWRGLSLALSGSILIALSVSPIAEKVPLLSSAIPGVIVMIGGLFMAATQLVLYSERYTLGRYMTNEEEEIKSDIRWNVAALRKTSGKRRRLAHNGRAPS